MPDLEQTAKTLRSNYYKKWREKNKDKVKQTNERYWIKRAKKELEKKEHTDE